MLILFQKVNSGYPMYLKKKGSITVDGYCLRTSERKAEDFTFSIYRIKTMHFCIIPYSVKQNNLILKTNFPTVYDKILLQKIPSFPKKEYFFKISV